MLSIRFETDVERLETYLKRIKAEDDFTQVVLEGINAMQRFQRAEAPRGVEGSIPRSIRPAKVLKGLNVTSATSSTRNKKAVFTNEGTGIHGPSGSRYEIVQQRTYKSGPRKGQPYEINISHPGIRGTHWWERGAEQGSTLALKSFRNKVERMLDMRR